MRAKWVLCFLLLLECFAAFAQRNCQETLQLSRSNFDKGHLYSIPSILKPCIDKGFTKQEKIQAYWLLTQVYLLVDDPISAEDSYLKLLNLDPEYKVDEVNDPVELVYLSRNFKTTPVFSWHMAKVGVNIGNFTVINAQSMDGSNQSKGDYKSKLGFQIGTGLEIHLNDKISGIMDVSFMQRSFDYNRVMFGKDVLFKKERNSFFVVDLGGKYKFNKKKIAPFVLAGFSMNMLLGSNYEFNYTNSQGSEGAFESSGPSESNSNQRTSFNYGAYLGGGAQMRLKYSFVSFEIKYFKGFNSNVDRSVQYPFENGYHSDKNFLYAHVDDDYIANSFLFNISWIKPLYKPRKINKLTTKNIFNRIFKKNK